MTWHAKAPILASHHGRRSPVAGQEDQRLPPSQAALLLCRPSSVRSASPDLLAALTVSCCENGPSGFRTGRGEAAGLGVVLGVGGSLCSYEKKMRTYYKNSAS